MAVLVLILVATLIVLVFTIVFFTNASFRQAIEAPKFQLLESSQNTQTAMTQDLNDAGVNDPSHLTINPW